MTGLTVLPVPGFGCEDVAVATHGPHEGSVYTGTEDGAIWRVGHDGSRIDRVAQTGGRPLGIEVDPEGRLLVSDAHRGVLRVDVRNGAIERVTDSVGGRRMLLVDNASVAADGTVWFSDSSMRYELAQWKSDFAEDTRTGRLVRHDPDGTTSVALDGLAFANGVALAVDESWVAVAESGAARVTRLWLSGGQAGRSETLVDLPAYPDNISIGSDGVLWVTLASPVDPLVERIKSGPMWLRRSVTRIPERFQPAPRRTARVQAYDAAGPSARLVHDLDLTGPDFHMVTGVREHDGRVWLGSLAESAIAVVDL